MMPAATAGTVSSRVLAAGRRFGLSADQLAAAQDPLTTPEARRVAAKVGERLVRAAIALRLPLDVLERAAAQGR